MRTLLATLAAVLFLAAGCSDSDDGDEAATDPDPSVTTAIAPATSADTAEAAPTTAPAVTDASLQFSVEGVTGGGAVPVEFTCDGANETPAVTLETVPAGVEELALIVDDPDAPTASPFVHWVVYGIGPDTDVVTDGDDALVYGVNDAGTDTWFGPCPPPDDGPHTYRWRLFGLSDAAGLEPGLDGRALETASAEVMRTESVLIASYERAT